MITDIQPYIEIIYGILKFGLAIIAFIFGIGIFIKGIIKMLG